jgi:hypothetical protein
MYTRDCSCRERQSLSVALHACSGHRALVALAIANETFGYVPNRPREQPEF